METRRPDPKPDSPLEEWVDWLKATAAVVSMMPDGDLARHLSVQVYYTAKAME